MDCGIEYTEVPLEDSSVQEPVITSLPFIVGRDVSLQLPYAPMSTFPNGANDVVGANHSLQVSPHLSRRASPELRTAVFAFARVFHGLRIVPELASFPRV